jgi:transposase-like protein
MPKAIHAQEDLKADRAKAKAVVEKLEEMRLPKAARIVREGAEEAFSYMSLPREHGVRIRTNNPLGRILKEVRRRTRVVGAFSDGQSALTLVPARLRDIAGTRWEAKGYLVDCDTKYFMTYVWVMRFGPPLEGEILSDFNN